MPIMNQIVILCAIVGLLTIETSLPLIKRKIKMNSWYGIRISESFKSEERWYEINEYGGRLMLWLGIVLIVVAGIGLVLPQKYWVVYAFSVLGVIAGGFGVVTVRIFRYVARTRST